MVLLVAGTDCTGLSYGCGVLYRCLRRGLILRANRAGFVRHGSVYSVSIQKLDEHLYCIFWFDQNYTHCTRSEDKVTPVSFQKLDDVSTTSDGSLTHSRGNNLFILQEMNCLKSSDSSDLGSILL